MQKRISLYVGLNNTAEENLQLLHKAASMGITRIFTSLHIPQTNPLDRESGTDPAFRRSTKSSYGNHLRYFPSNTGII